MQDKKGGNGKPIIIFMVILALFVFAPGLGIILLIIYGVVQTKKKQPGATNGNARSVSTQYNPNKKQQGLDSSMKLHKDNTYDENKKSDYHGVSRDILDQRYTTRELYESIAHRKTDYRGVNKDLL